MLRNDNYFLIFTKIIIWLLSYFLNHQTKLLCILNLGLLGLTNSSKRKTEDHTDYIKNGRSFKHIRLLVLHKSRLLTIQWFFSRLFLTFLQKHEKYTLTVDNHFTLTDIQNPSVTTDDTSFLSGQALAPVPCIPCPHIHAHFWDQLPQQQPAPCHQQNDYSALIRIKHLGHNFLQQSFK